MIVCRSQLDSHTRSIAPHPSGAFTLWELLLALAIMVTIAVLSFPALSRLLAEDRVHRSLSLLQEKFAAARIHALEQQVPYQFRYEPGGRKFILIPAYFAENSSQPNSTSTVKRPWIAAEELPDKMHLEAGVNHTASQTATNSTAASTDVQIPSDWLSDIPNNGRFQGVNWSPPVLIRPDGSATAAEIVLVDQKKTQYRLLVRGLTGTLLVQRGPQ
ncbi:MAG: hypothetical protein U0903_21510 [Planctomycetales bacterium]